MTDGIRNWPLRCTRFRKKERAKDRPGMHIYDWKLHKSGFCFIWVLFRSGTENLQCLVKLVKMCFPVSPPRVKSFDPDIFPFRMLRTFLRLFVAQKPLGLKKKKNHFTAPHVSSTRSLPSAAAPPLKADWSRATLRRRRRRAPDWFPHRQKQVLRIKSAPHPLQSKQPAKDARLFTDWFILYLGFFVHV